VRARATVTAALALAWPAGAARAVGLEGAADQQRRVGGGLAAGWDHVGGVGRDSFPFVEGYGHGDARLWRGLVGGAALSLRRDLGDYNHALERWRGGSTGVALQLALGFESPRFHASAGPWLLGDNRDGRAFRLWALPFGVLRLRFGHLDRWHVNVRLIDGAPYTAEAGGPGFRLQIAPPPRGRHRLSFGVYTSLGEKVAGLAVTDEIAGLMDAGGPAGWLGSLGRPGSTLRVGGLLGTAIGHAGTRPELTLFAGVVY
jgi:hypothetical protein